MKHLYESIFDEDIVTRKADPEEYKKQVLEFLEKNYETRDTHGKGFKCLDIKTDLKHGFIFTVNFNGSLYALARDITSLTNGLFKFGTITGDFGCSRLKNLKSLEGAPEKVGRWFNCRGCNIKSLEGAPKYVGEIFDCSECNSLKSLEGAPEKVGSFDCGGCDNLKSLEGAPKKVGGDFKCKDCINLETLKGAPEAVRYDFVCTGCPKLKSLECAPKKIGGNLLSDNGIMG